MATGIAYAAMTFLGRVECRLARFPLRGARASAGAFQGWSGREDDGSAGVAAGCLCECLGGVGEAVAGGDRNLKLPVRESPREFAQLVSVRADVDAGDRDAALLAGRVWGDGRQPPAVGHRPDRSGRTAACRVDCGDHSVASRYRADLFGPFFIVVVDDLARPQRAYPLLACGAGRRDDLGAAQRAKGDQQAAGDSAGTVDQELLIGADV